MLPWPCLLHALASCLRLSFWLGRASLPSCELSASPHSPPPLHSRPAPCPALPSFALVKVIPDREIDSGTWPICSSARLCELMQLVQLLHVPAHVLRTAALTNRIHVPLDLSSHCNIGTGPLCSDHAGPRFGALQGTDSLHRVKTICQVSCTSPEER